MYYKLSLIFFLKYPYHFSKKGLTIEYERVQRCSLLFFYITKKAEVYTPALI